MRKVKYKCKDNDANLELHFVDGVIDEILVKADGDKSWTVLGYQNLLDGIEKAKLERGITTPTLEEYIKMKKLVLAYEATRGRITDEPITYQVLEDMGFKYEGETSEDEAPQYSKGDLFLIECYEKESNSFLWVDDKTNKHFRTIEDLLRAL